MNTKRTQMHNINFMTCSKAEIYESMVQKLIIQLHFTKSPKRDNVYELFFMTPRRTYMPSINTLACPKTEI